MIYYAIGTEEDKCWGHGDYSSFISIQPIDAYMGKTEYYPIFENKQDAQKYLSEIKWNRKLSIVELNLFTSNKIN